MSQSPSSAVKPLATAVTLALVAFSQPGIAANCTWNTTTGNWSGAGNWSCGLIPGVADSATVGAAKTVTINSMQGILNLTNAGGVNIDFNQLALQFGGSTTNTGTINVGAGPFPNNATLQINAGHNVNNAGGTINVSADSVVKQMGGTISGGTINTTGTGKLMAFATGSNFLDGVTLNGTLDMASYSIERITNGLALNGTVNIGGASIFAPQGNQTISGTGNIVFVDNNSSNRLNVEAGNLTLGSGITVHGYTGYIGQQTFAGGTATLTNQGTIAADTAGGYIDVNVNGGVTNTGTMRANNGGILWLDASGPGIANAGGTIRADNNGAVFLNGVTIDGGTLTTTTGGVLMAASNGNNFLNNTALTANSVLDLATKPGAVERITGGMTLNGTVNIAQGSVLAPQGNQTISGNGNIVFADNNGSNRLNVESGNLTLGSGITVHGNTGYIGQQAFAGGAATLTNNGTIAADVSGGTITINVNGATVNNGTLAAQNGGTLLLSSSVTNNAGSQILAGAGSTVWQNGVTLNGVINVNGTGSFRTSNSSNNFLDNATFTGTLDLASSYGVERITNGLALNGTVNIAQGSVLAPQGNQTISGNGNIVFADNNGSNRLNVESGNLTLGSGITVHGNTGYIGQQAFAGGAATLTNNGTIAADVSGGTITINVNGATVNNGTLAAQNGGTLLLSSSVTNNAGSQILAGAGSTVWQNGVTLNGVINVNGTGSFRTSNSSNNFLDNATFTGTLDLASSYGVERITNGLALNGTVNIAQGSVLAPQGNQTISGNGNIVFADNNGSNRLNVESGNLTLGSGITVHGNTGYIGQQAFAGGAATLTNNGTIAADVSGGTITINVNGATVNNGTLAAQNGGTLLLSSSVTNNAGSQILAGAGSTVWQNGVTLNGVTNLNGTGSFRATNSSNNFLDSVTLTSTLDLASSYGVERITNGLALNGTVNIAQGSVLAPQGNQTISGNGNIVFADNNGSNRLNVESGNLTLGSGITVHGNTGYIGQQAFAGGAATLTNNGTIAADVSGGTITINVNGALTNNGLFRAQNGTLAVQSNVNGTGTLLVDSTGVMNLANGGNSQGKLAMGAAGAALNIGNGNLVIGSDYTNTAAGSGNGFNRRAGVSGTGQIVAGGDVSQVITGAGVTGGNTANATLTLSNVRVGATTFNYQIGNAGTTGPTLRGAIQTSVNGANLTDSRLSGTGVTASNYNAGAWGGNSGNLAVTFNAASAGALAPLSGQVLNLRSNFDNIADQKLNIVLAGGAAAYNAAVGSATPAPVVIANQRVGGIGSQALTVSNTSAAGSYSEDLSASFGGNTGNATNNGGSLAAVLAGASNAAAMKVGVDTTSAGAKSGTVTLNYGTTGTVNGSSNGLGVASVGSQTITVSGNVYQVAAGALQGNTLNFGTLQVGQQVSQNLVVRNTATGPAGFVEDLNASFGASGDSQITGTGSLNGIFAGNNSTGANGTMTVKVLGSTAGALNSGIAVNYFSAGAVNGVSNGLGVLGVGSEQFNVNGTIQAVGNVINQASPQINNGTINLGNVRVGAVSPTANVSVTNVATVAPQAALNASITGNAPITATGSFNLLNPGATNNSSLSVGMNTGTAGAVNGTATIAFVSDASNVGGCAPNCQLNLASQNVNVTGGVYNVAQPAGLPANVNVGHFRTNGSPVTQTVALTNTNISPAGFQEGLNATIAGTGGAATASGALSNVAAGGSGNLVIGVSGVAGVNSGTVQVQLATNGTGTSGLGTLNLGGPQTVNVSGTGHTAAQAAVQSTVNFGIVHVGDSVAQQGVSVQNSAAPTALNDTLKASIGGTSGAFTNNGGTVSGLTAGGAANTSALTVGLNTAAAGIFSGNAVVSLASQNPDMADLGLANASVALSGQVNKYANAVFNKVSGAGTLSQSSNIFTLDFGNIMQGSGSFASILNVRNLVGGGPADLLDGTFNITDGNDFADLLLLAGLANIGADASSGNALSFLFDTNTLGLGSFQDSINLDWFGHNAGGYSDAMKHYTLLIKGSIYANGGTVPEPPAALLVLAALAGMAALRRRRMAMTGRAC